MSLTIEIDPLNVLSGTSYLNALQWVGGMVADWAIKCPRNHSMRLFIQEQYGHPFSAAEMPKGSWLDAECKYCYKDEEGEEEPLPPLIAFTRNNNSESLYIYQYGICCFVSANDAPCFVRLD